MNRSLSFLVIVLLLFASCRKPAPGNVYPPNSLPGTWKYTEHYLSIGAPGKWYPVQPSGQTVEFKPDGRFQSTEGFSRDFSHYEVIDTERVKFTPAPVSSGYVMMKYQFDAGSGTLVLYPIDPMCIEGCAYKFVRPGQ